MRKVVEEFFLKHDKDPVCRCNTTYTPLWPGQLCSTIYVVLLLLVLYGDYILFYFDGWWRGDLPHIPLHTFILIVSYTAAGRYIEGRSRITRSYFRCGWGWWRWQGLRTRNMLTLWRLLRCFAAALNKRVSSSRDTTQATLQEPPQRGHSHPTTPVII